MEAKDSLTVAFSSSAFFGLLFLIFLLTIDPFTVYENLKFAVRMSGSEINSIPLNCVLTREFLVKTKLRAVTVADFYHRGGNGPTTAGVVIYIYIYI